MSGNIYSLNLHLFVHFSPRSVLPSVKQYVTIKNGILKLNGNPLFSGPPLPFADFADSWYRHSGISYPKFHKMDSLSKLGFIGADILLNNSLLIKNTNSYNTGVVLSNRTSSLDTDYRHQRQIKQGPASPAVFVYSLPNIVIGEICIRHGIKGENTFFIESVFDLTRQVAYINLLFETGALEVCIGGWVELLGDEYELFLYLAQAKSDENTALNIENIKRLYSQSL